MRRRCDLMSNYFDHLLLRGGTFERTKHRPPVRHWMQSDHPRCRQNAAASVCRRHAVDAWPRGSRCVALSRRRGVALDVFVAHAGESPSPSHATLCPPSRCQQQHVQLELDAPPNNTFTDRYWVKVLRPTRHKTGLFGDVLPSQSLGVILKKLNLTQQKQTTQEQNSLS